MREEEEKEQVTGKAVDWRGLAIFPETWWKRSSHILSAVELLVGRGSVGFTVVWYPRTLPPGSQA